jgi:xanthine dehydrogenase small subunit
MSGTHHIRFLLDGSIHEVGDVNPCTTVLDYLREYLGRTGTKEGCAEGDCGACTIVVAEPVEGRLRYRSINACIALLASMDGKELLSVESIARRDGAMHPVQEAMVQHHGSQCGFCTPGIVMSLFALYRTEQVTSREQVDECLSGNLCRCTGYRPIIDAALDMHALGSRLADDGIDRLTCPPDKEPLDDERAIVEMLSATSPPELRRMVGPSLSGAQQTVLIPNTKAALLQAAHEHPDATLAAGSTEIGVWLNKLHQDLGVTIIVTEVDELRSISSSEGVINIGAAAPLTDVHAAMMDEYPELDELFKRFASPPVRNAATLGGNLANASPIGDMPPALMALEARVVLESLGGVREVPLDEFFTGYRTTVIAPGEVMTHVLVPCRPAGMALRVHKVSRRIDQDISAVCGAFAITFGGAEVATSRVAFGGVAATPVRLKACEAALLGTTLTSTPSREALAAIEASIKPLSDVRASADYRMRIATNLLRRTHMEIAGVEPTRVHAIDVGDFL